MYKNSQKMVRIIGFSIDNAKILSIQTNWDPKQASDINRIKMKVTDGQNQPKIKNYLFKTIQ